MVVSVLSLLSSRRRFGFVCLILVVASIFFLQSSDYRTNYLPPTSGFSLPTNKNKIVDNGVVDNGEFQKPPPPPPPNPPVFEEKPSKPADTPLLKSYDHVVEDPNKMEEVSQGPENVPEDMVVGSPWTKETSEAGTATLSTGSAVTTTATPATTTQGLLTNTTDAESEAPTEASLKPIDAGTLGSTISTTPEPLHMTWEVLQAKIKQLIRNWTPPAVKNHWPPYEWYKEDNYNPNRWEAFDWENDYYVHNGIQELRDRGLNSTPYRPYPDYNSLQWKRQWAGEYTPCFGPRGKLYNESNDDVIKAFHALPEHFPDFTVGDANVTGIDLGYCFDRYQRYGPYGIGQSVGQTAGDWERPAEGLVWAQVRWGELQESCFQANRDRYQPSARMPTQFMSQRALPNDAGEMPKPLASEETGKAHHARTAILIRAYEGYEFEENDIQAIRALISELSLQSGGEYQVFLYINIKDNGANIYNDTRVYDELVRAYAPPEFHDITILWSEAALPEWYPKVHDWQVYWQQFMCLQYFTKMHPEFDYIWNWEVDARYTGHHYSFLEGVANFSRNAPRKFLWERNARYYIPSAHGTYDDFIADTDAEIKRGIEEGTVNPVWGAQPYDETRQQPIGPPPPSPMSADDFAWGVGEEADLITLLPIWDPAKTEWTMKDKIWNFVPGVHPTFEKSPIAEGFTHPDFIKIPRRAYINTLSRFSRKLLHAMHLENVAGRSMQAELWPATVALQHGLKAVYAPHPIWLDRRWPAWYLDAVINANDNRTARWGAEVDSPYNHDREHNFAGWSWYYQSDFPSVLYRRWLGWVGSVGPAKQFPNNPLRVLGGEDFEGKETKLTFPPSVKPDGSQAAPAGGDSFGGVEVGVGGKGRMCLPPMLLHPVKYVNKDEPQEL